jgi:exodeoxyribonuclease VII large subunit
MEELPLFASPEPLTVSELVGQARSMLEERFPSVLVKGELSRFVHHGSGHMYFQLKDAGASVSAVMFRGNNRRLRFQPEDGMDVLLEGRISLYEPRGQFQLIASHMEPLGLGSLHVALEQLKARLAAEGLFDQERKRPIPTLPLRIGIATSPTGAAVRDMLRVLGRRFADVHVLIAPCRVQGDGAAAEIVRALARLDAHTVDVILLARGGGSIEDLWAFNEEPVARAVAASDAPVITGIGHEIDVTVADLVADLRAATPSAAAEVVIRSKVELVEQLAGHGRRLHAAVERKLARRREGLRALESRPGLQSVPRQVQDAQQRVDDLAARARRTVERLLAQGRAQTDLLGERLSPRSLAARVVERRARAGYQLQSLLRATRASMEARGAELRRRADLLESFSPLAVLARGYSICRDESGKVVRDGVQVTAGAPVQVKLHRGSLDCRVEQVNAAEEA